MTSPAYNGFVDQDATRGSNAARDELSLLPELPGRLTREARGSAPAYPAQLPPTSILLVSDRTAGRLRWDRPSPQPRSAA
jgi:hypothetical protein